MHGVVEGEPGIFPDPVARLLRTVGGWFGGRRRGSGDRQERPTDGGDPDRGQDHIADSAGQPAPDAPADAPEAASSGDAPADEPVAGGSDEPSGADKPVE